MIHVEEILEDLEGNGFNQKDLLTVSMKLTFFSNLREELSEMLLKCYEEEDVLDILGVLKQPDEERSYIARYLGESLTEKQKEIYLLNVVEGRSMGNIAKYLGLSKSSVQSQINRARAKLREAEIEKLGGSSPGLHKVIMDNSPQLTDRQREYYKMHYVDGKSTKEIVEELGVDRRTVQFMISHAKSRVTIPQSLYAYALQDVAGKQEYIANV